VNSYAIVIGIEQYWLPENCLDGPLHDALGFRSWLLDKGGATDRTLRLLLSPLAEHAVPAGVSFEAATWDNIMRSVEDAAREAAEADRLFFYFSGHGIQDALEPRKPILLASDFSDKYQHTHGRVVYLDAVEDFLLLKTQIPEQFFISDACRDFRYQLETVKIGDPNPFNLSWKDLPAGQHSVLQLRIAAASPGGGVAPGR
jgi:Caspase domain